MMKVHSSEEFTFVPAQGAPIDHKALSEFLDDPSVEFWVHFADDDLGTTSCTLVGGFGTIDCELFSGDRSLVADVFLVRGELESPGQSVSGAPMYLFTGHHVDDSALNIFKLANPEWFVSSKARNDAVAIFESASTDVKQVLRLVLDAPAILQRFCSVPSSVANHHSFRGGNLEHTLETVTLVRNLSSNYLDVDRELSELWAWFHDLGKIESYQCVDKNLDVYQHSDLGKKFGLYALTLKLLFEQLKGHGLQGNAENLISNLLHVATSVHATSSNSHHHDTRICRFEKEKSLVKKCDSASASFAIDIRDIRIAEGSVFL